MKRQLQLGIINLLAAGMLLTSAGTPALAAELPPTDTPAISTAAGITDFSTSDTPGPVTRDQRRAMLGTKKLCRRVSIFCKLFKLFPGRAVSHNP